MRSPIPAVALLFVLGCASPERAPDVHGMLVLAENAAAPAEGILKISAHDTSPTREGRSLTMEMLQRDVRDLALPFPFELQGQGGPATHREWIVSAEVVVGDAQTGFRTTHSASQTFTLECTDDSREAPCFDAQVRIELEERASDGNSN